MLKLKRRSAPKNQEQATEEDLVPATRRKASAVRYAHAQDPRDEFRDLRSQLRIDKHNLDDDCMRQPVLYQEISEQHVLAQGERDAAKERLAAVDAKVADEIRKKWTRAGEKFAEVRVGDAVQLDARHIEAYGEWSHLVRRAAYLGTLVASADQRGKMLRELGGLYVAGYFSRVVSGKGAREASAGAAADAREGMRRRRSQD